MRPLYQRLRYTALDELGVAFITLRQRSPKLIATLEQLPASGWTKTRLDRAGKHKTASYHEHPVTLKGRTFRQLAVNGLGRDQPTLLLTNRQDLTPKQLIERYAKRWGIENQLAEQIRAFHLDSLCAQVPLAVDFDVALTILADLIYRHFAHGLHAAYRNQTPDTLRAQLIDEIGELRFTPGHIEVALRRRTHTPVTRRQLPRQTHRGSLVGRPHPQLQLPRPLTQAQKAQSN